jgi:hypothetical protein
VYSPAKVSNEEEPTKELRCVVDPAKHLQHNTTRVSTIYYVKPQHQVKSQCTSAKRQAKPPRRRRPLCITRLAEREPNAKTTHLAHRRRRPLCTMRLAEREPAAKTTHLAHRRRSPRGLVHGTLPTGRSPM